MTHARRIVIAGLAGCGSSEPATLEPVIPGCVTLDHQATFANTEDLAPAVPGTLAGWDPTGRWFTTGVPSIGNSSVSLAWFGERVVIDGDPDAGATLDATQLFMRRERDDDGRLAVEAFRITNQQPDGTLRAERAGCSGGICEVCTTKLIRAEHHASEGDGDHLTLVGELGGGPTWDDDFTLNVRVAGTLAYLIRRDGLHIIETADPAHPVELGYYRGATRVRPNDVKLVDAGARRFALISDTPVDVVDVTDPAAPILAAQIPELSHTVFTETRDGRTLAYFGTYDGTCPVYDVTDPAAPVKLGSYASEASLIHDLSVVDGVAYLNAWELGFLAVDFTTPSAPRLVGRWATTPAHASHSNWTTTAGGRHVALHGDEGYGARLDIVDIDPASPRYMSSIAAWQTRPWISIHNLMAFGDKAYLTYYQDGVRVLDLSDPLHPAQLGYFNTWDPQGRRSSGAFFEGAVGLDVDLARKLVFVADSPRGLVILRDATRSTGTL